VVSPLYRKHAATDALAVALGYLQLFTYVDSCTACWCGATHSRVLDAITCLTIKLRSWVRAYTAWHPYCHLHTCTAATLWYVKAHTHMCACRWQHTGYAMR
jgi:hypothetical protein